MSAFDPKRLHAFGIAGSRENACGVAPTCGTQMDFGHNQRFGTTLGLSEGSGVVPLLVFKNYLRVGNSST